MHSRSLAEVIAELAADVPFPGRLRVFCEPALAHALPHGHQGEWPGLRGGGLAAVACGAAVAERRRGGRVLAVTSAVDDGLFAEAATLAGRLGLDNLHVLMAVDEPGLLVRFGRVASDRPWGQGATQQVALSSVASASTATSPSSGSTTSRRLDGVVPVRREWPPVHLAALAKGGAAPWPTSSASSPVDAVASALSWMAEREPRLLAPHADPAWRTLPDTPAKLLALGHLCAEGLRVAWLLPPRAPVMRWLDELRDIGRRGLAMKLLCHAEDLPALDHLAALDGWWVAMPGDTAEAGAVLARALETEDAFIIALPGAAVEGSAAYPAEQPWSPGSGRWLADGADLTLACTASTAGIALRARAGLLGESRAAGVFQCTSLSPLPMYDLHRAGARAPLVALDDGRPAGFARLVAESLAPGTRFAVASGVPGRPLAVEDAVRAARALAR